MSDRAKGDSSTDANSLTKDTVNTQAKGQITASGEPVPAMKSSFLVLLVYAILFGSGAALLTAAYIIAYNWGVTFFEQPSHFGLTIGRFWPLILLTGGGLLLGLAIKFTGQRGGLGVAQREYGQNGLINPYKLTSI